MPTGVPLFCTYSWCVILTCVHKQMASNSQYTLPPQSSLQKKPQALSPSYTQSRAQMNHPQRIFHDYWWLFWTLHILRYGARLVEERRRKRRTRTRTRRIRRKKKEDEQFWLSTISGLLLKIHVVTTRCYYRLGQALKAALCTFRCEHLFPGDDITV